MRRFCHALILLLVGFSVEAAAMGLQHKIRVDVLSTLSPRRVSVLSTSALRLSSGSTLPAGARLQVDLQDRSLRVREHGKSVWRGDSLVVGDVGNVVSVEVTGRNRRNRRLPGPIVLTVRENRIAIRSDFALEDLVVSAISAEMKDARETAALEAAAIAVRSYFGASVGRHARDGFDVCDSTHCVHSVGLVGRDQNGEPRFADAARKTEGYVLVRDDHLVAGFISASCGGHTTTPHELWGSVDKGDYVAVSCAWCRASRSFSWKRVLPASSVAGAVSDALELPVRSDFSIRTERGDGGWVRSVRVADGARDHRMGGDAFRLAIGRRLGWDSLPSPNFAVSRERGSFIFVGAGSGHGIGLCLDGTIERARRGDSAETILRIYYPRATVVSLPRASGGV